MAIAQAAAGILAAALVASAPFTPAYAQITPPVDENVVSIGQARQLGLHAIQQGRPDIAAKIALALLEKDKTDSFAHFLLANGMVRLGRAKEAEAAAKQAYRHATTQEQSFQAAHLAAELAYMRGGLMTSQWWLRKSAEAAPDKAREAKSIAQFKAVKALNPWRFQFAFSARPSDNVNNGSSGQYNIIDGLPFVGALSQDAQAVKGVVADAAVSLGYRIRKSETTETSVGLNLSKRHVQLSSVDKARLGGGAGFGSARAEISLRHDWQVAGGKHGFHLEGSLGRQSYEGGGSYSFAGLGFGHRVSLSPTLLIASALDVEQRSKQAGQRGDRSFAIRSTMLRQLDRGDLITATLLANRFDTVAAGRSSTTIGAQLGYSLAKPVHEVGISTTIGVQKSRYQGYSLAGLAVPGGRTDTTAFAEVKLQFNQISYAGFAPQLRLRHQRTQSNVSRFEANETSVVLGITSKF